MAYILVDSIHKIYCERKGNIEGQDILFLHGGPGLGYNTNDFQFFDFDSCNVVFFDQRGSGKSIPKGKIHHNDISLLCKDIHKIIEFYQLKDVIIFGGSWGSTLALFYTIHNPHNIKTLLLRGLFMASKEERQYFEKGGTIKEFPSAWNRLRSIVPSIEDNQVCDKIFEEILYNKDQRKKFAFELSLYGSSISQKAEPTIDLEKKIKTKDFTNPMLILSHYSKNNFFMENGFIEKNLNRIKNIPVHIVHGKEDHITRIEFARRIAQNHKNISIYESSGGHSPYEKPNFILIQQILNDLI